MPEKMRTLTYHHDMNVNLTNMITLEVSLSGKTVGHLVL